MGSLKSETGSITYKTWNEKKNVIKNSSVTICSLQKNSNQKLTLFSKIKQFCS